MHSSSSSKCVGRNLLLRKAQIIDGTCRLNPLAAGLNLNPGLKADASNKEIEEAMKRVREAQSLISAAIEPGSQCSVSPPHSHPLLLAQELYIELSIISTIPFNSALLQVKKMTSANIPALVRVHNAGAPGLVPDTGEDMLDKLSEPVV